MKWNRFPVLLIHVREEECVFHLPITCPIPVDVHLGGKVFFSHCMTLNQVKF